MPTSLSLVGCRGTCRTWTMDALLIRLVACPQAVAERLCVVGHSRRGRGSNSSAHSPPFRGHSCPKLFVFFNNKNKVVLNDVVAPRRLASFGYCPHTRVGHPQAPLESMGVDQDKRGAEARGVRDAPVASSRNVGLGWFQDKREAANSRLF